MTVAALTSTKLYLENGVTLAFAAPFRFLAGSLVVERIFVDGTVLALAPGTGYSVTGGATDAGGTVTLVATVAGAKLRIRRQTPLSQPADYTTGDRFPAESHEGALDRLTLIAQEEADARAALAASAVVVPPGEAGTVLPTLATRAGKLARWNGSGAFVPLQTGVAGLVKVGADGTVQLLPPLDALGEINAAMAAAIAGKPDRYPLDPHMPLKTGLTRLLDGWYRHFFNTADNHIRPTDGSGGANTGMPDTVTTPSSWQAHLGFRVLYYQWRLAKLAGGTGAMNRIKAQMQGHWNWYRTFYSDANIKTGLGGIVNASDDASLHGQFLAQVHEVLGDANALAFLIEFIPYTNNRFHDVNQVQIDYGVATPGGIAFKSDPFGVTYFLPSPTGAFNCTQEIVTATAAHYVSQQSSVSAPLRAAFLAYAVNTWQWCFDLARASNGGSAPAPAVAPAPAIYFAGVDLDPAVATYKKGNRFAGDTGPPIRGQSAYADGMTLQMIVLSLKLWRSTGEAKYLAEAKAVAVSYMLPTGFGRTGPGGVPLIANARDPWVNGSTVPEWAFEDFFGDPATPGVPATGAEGYALAGAVYNTGQVICTAMADGYSTPDWVGDEYCPLTGYSRWTDDGGAGGQGGNPNVDYGAMGGGGQAAPRQIMTSSTIVNVAQAAKLLEPYVQDRGSGLVTAQAIERLPARMAALEIGQSLLVPRSGGYVTGNLAWDTENRIGRGADGNPVWNVANGWLHYFDRATNRFGFYAAGVTALSIGGSDAKFYDGVYFNGRQTSEFYASHADGPFLNLGYNSYFGNSASRVRFEFTYGGITGLTIDGNGVVQTKSHLVPMVDAVPALGGPAQRWAQLYAATSTINTSDAREKAVRGPLTPAEIAVGRWIAAHALIFRYLDDVATKGDAARLHAGWIAQQVFAAFTAQGLDPTRYGVCCYDAWPAHPGYPEQPAIAAADAVRDDAGIVITPAVGPQPYRAAVPPRAAGDRYSLRLDELYAFVIAAQEQRLAALEAA